MFSRLEKRKKEKRDNQKVVSLLFGSLNRSKSDFSSSGVSDVLMDGFQYVNGVLQFFPHAEGYVKATPTGNITPGSPPTGYAYNYVFNYTDHLGNIRLSYTKDPQQGTLKILEENHYYPFGLKHEVYVTGSKRDFIENSNDPGETILTNVLKTDYQYKYNGKEWQDELNLNVYAMDMRQYDPAIARWVVHDPIIHFNQSPYSSFDGNPVFWADPSGAATSLQEMWDATPENGSSYWVNTGDGNFEKTEEDENDDDITVNSYGIVTKVVRNNNPNRFFDENGNELFFNDPNDVDAHMLDGKFKIGDGIFYYLSKEKYVDYIKETGLIPIYLSLFIRYAMAVKKSHNEWDFAETYLINFINPVFDNSDSRRRQGYTKYLSESGYFRLGNTNYIYNLYDGGNYIWATAMRLSGFSYREAMLGSQFNEMFNDSEADQRAIKRAYED